MAEELDYKGYKITANSYKDEESGLWVPRASVTSIDEAQISEMPLSWEREFDTGQQADDFALESAQIHIDTLL
ncbi:MAG: hypothetical protein WDZ39_00560 [Candidatus Spechtbacterales bacterium]